MVLLADHTTKMGCSRLKKRAHLFKRIELKHLVQQNIWLNSV